MSIDVIELLFEDEQIEEAKPATIDPAQLAEGDLDLLMAEFTNSESAADKKAALLAMLRLIRK